MCDFRCHSVAARECSRYVFFFEIKNGDYKERNGIKW